MNLSEFLPLLLAHPNKGITLSLPDGTTAPAHFHITEVGHTTRSFIDCGGTRHSIETCLLQVWVARDYNHRIEAGKLAGILEKAADLFPTRDVPVEFEHEAPVLTQLTIESHEVLGDVLNFKLAHKATDCLAKDVCLPKPDFSLPDITSRAKTSIQLFSRLKP